VSVQAFSGLDSTQLCNSMHPSRCSYCTQIPVMLYKALQLHASIPKVLLHPDTSHADMLGINRLVAFVSSCWALLS
jgi:hypothetical protein